MKISKLETLKAMEKGEQLEKVPYAVWRHFPRDDLKAESLAKKQLEYLEKFDSILMKVSPNGRYCVVDWGCEIAFDEKKMSGSAHCTNYRVKEINDWETLEELDVQEGMYGEQLEALKLIDKGITDGTPFVETVFNPLMVASKLTKTKELLLQSIKENPKGFKEGLKTITKVTTEFARIAVENGASGVFLATQEATYDLFTEEQFKEYILQYDLQVLQAIKQKADFNIVHIHGENIMFDLIAEHYPVNALNWHDQLTAPSIAEAQTKFDGIVMGGIEEKEFLLQASKEEISQKVQEVVASANNKRLIIAPGCVIPINIPDKKVFAAINALK